MPIELTLSQLDYIHTKNALFMSVEDFGVVAYRKETQRQEYRSQYGEILHVAVRAVTGPGLLHRHVIVDL